jgi:hypothetical protein
MVNLQLQLFFTLFELSRIFHEGRQYPQNGGFWPSWERVIKINSLAFWLDELETGNN